MFKRNQFFENLINKAVKAYLDNKVNSAPSDKNDIFNLNYRIFTFPVYPSVKSAN